MATIPVDSRINSKTAEFFSRQHRMLIDGRFVLAASGKTFPVYNPATGEVVAQVPEAEAEDVNRAVIAARRAFDEGPWSKMSTSQRGQLIWKVADLLEANLEEFAEIESLDNGKPFSVARVADLPLAIDMFRYMAGWSTKISGSTLNFSTPGAFHSYTMREPIGVVGQIIPWNFPLLMAAWKLAPALAAGCCVVLKVAEQTPMSALRLAELFDQAGFPPGVVNILTGFGEGAGAPLAAHPMVDKVAFTGSTEVGKLIVKASAGNLKRVSLELGGKSPAIIFPDADLERAIPGTASAIFFNQGQCCCAGSRLFAHESVYEKVLQGVSDIAGGINMGPGIDPKTEMGPLVSEEQFDKSHRLYRLRHQGGSQGSCRRQTAWGPRVFRSAHRADQYQTGHEGGAGRDLRTGGMRRIILRRRSGSRGTRGERQHLWTRRQCVDAGSEHRAQDGAAPPGRYGLDQLPQRLRRFPSLWRI